MAGSIDFKMYSAEDLVISLFNLHSETYGPWLAILGNFFPKTESLTEESVEIVCFQIWTILIDVLSFITFSGGCVSIFKAWGLHSEEYSTD